MASLSIPHSFTNNTVASATEVNANFASVKSFAESNVVQVDGSVQAGSTAIANLAVTQGKIADGAVTSAKIEDLTIVNGDISNSAGIVDTKLATIATAGKVSNSATTATSGPTANTIVSRDGSGNFSANVINAVTSLGAGRGVGIQADPTNTSAILQFTNNGASAQLASLVATNNLITATTPITATSFNGPLTGNVTGNVTGSSGSCTGNAATATNVAYSGLTGAVPTWNQNTTGNAATATTASTVSNGSITAAKLSGISGLTYGQVAITMSTVYEEYTFTIPNGRSYQDVVSVHGLEGTNDIVWIAGVAMGFWSGIQGPNQIRILARLGNGVASNTGYVRVWFAN